MATSQEKAWVLCLNNAKAALRRVETALIELRPNLDACQPLIECMWWVCETDEALEDEFADQWKSLRKADPDLKEKISGLQWARDHAARQICQWEIGKPPFRWDDAQSIEPKGDNTKKKQDRARKRYEDHLQGEVAREFLGCILKEITDKTDGLNQ